MDTIFANRAVSKQTRKCIFLQSLVPLGMGQLVSRHLAEVVCAMLRVTCGSSSVKIVLNMKNGPLCWPNFDSKITRSSTMWSIEFAAGLNLLTGETGAGKSILIDALGLLLGEKASSEVIRTGAERAVVAAVFESDGAAARSIESDSRDERSGRGEWLADSAARDCSRRQRDASSSTISRPPWRC